MRKVIAALQTSLDGFIEGPAGELDWAIAEDEEAWKDLFEMLSHVDTCIVGRVMYPDYERQWLAVLADPNGILPIGGLRPTENDIAYARFADKTPHILISRTLDKVAWKTTSIVRDVEAIRKLKQKPGKDMYVVGGAATVSSLINSGIVDEIRMVVNPLLLGGGKPLFKDVKERRPLTLVDAKPLRSGKVQLTYSTQS